jgi:hypothetical protein
MKQFSVVSFQFSVRKEKHREDRISFGRWGLLYFHFDLYAIHPESGVGFIEKLNLLNGHRELKGSGDRLPRDARLHFAGGKLDGTLHAAGCWPSRVG